jgi:hypothetical protein
MANGSKRNIGLNAASPLDLNKQTAKYSSLFVYHYLKIKLTFIYF